jgi:hypothetical protein
MKISNRNYPILEKLYKGSLGEIPVYADDIVFFDKLGTKLNDVWKHYRKYFIEDINVISTTFHQSSNKAFYKLIHLWNDIIINDISDFIVNGTYVVGDYVYMIHYYTKQGSESQSIALFVFTKLGMPVSFYVDNSNGIQGWISSTENINPSDKNEIQNRLWSRLAQPIIFHMFKSYAEVETKTLFSETRQKDSTNKYVNDTKLNLTFLDSKWFTSIVKSEGFSVRGHFRLQPKKKNGEWTKELIWVNEFNKLGYTAPARKLSSTSPPSYTPPAKVPHITA